MILTWVDVILAVTAGLALGVGTAAFACLIIADRDMSQRVARLERGSRRIDR